MEKWDVFISYSTKDRDFAAALHRDLEPLLPGREVFFDSGGIRPGDRWMAALQRALTDARHLVLVVSPASMASPWVHEELDTMMPRAVATSGKILPVTLFPAPVPPFLENREIDAQFTDYAGAVKSIVEAVRGGTIEVAEDLSTPPPATRYLDVALREDVVAFLAPLLEDALARYYFAGEIGPRAAFLKELPAPMAALAALELLDEDDTPENRASRVLDLAAADTITKSDDQKRQLTELRRRLAELAKDRTGDSLLDHYLRHLRQAHEKQLEFFGRRRATDTLSSVWVELAVRGDEILASARATMLEAHGERHPLHGLTLERLLTLDLADHPLGTRRWVLRGDPGSGKTTLLRHNAAEQAKLPAGGRPFLPTYIGLPQLLASGLPLTKLIETELAHLPVRGLADMLERLGRDGRLLVLLDSYDEVRREQVHQIPLLLADLTERWPDTPIVVATRKIGYEDDSFASQGFADLDLLPLDSPRKRLFLEKWFAPSAAESGADAGRGTGATKARADATLRQIEARDALRKLSGCPLYLTLLALLLEHEKNPDHLLLQHRLHDEVFDLLLESRHKPEHQREPMPAKIASRRLLAALAQEMTQTDDVALPPDQLEDLILTRCDEAWQPLEKVPPWLASRRRFLDEQARRTGILAAHDGTEEQDGTEEGEESEGKDAIAGAEEPAAAAEGAPSPAVPWTRPWRWWHKSFREALTAEFLDELARHDDTRARVLEWAKRIGDDTSRWAEPFAMFVGRSGKPDVWLPELHRENPDLALRALASVDHVDDQTLLQLLKADESDLDRRCEAYLRIYGLVDDAAVAVRLLDRLREYIRKRPERPTAQELWHLDEALRRVGETEEGQAVAGEIDASRERVVGFFEPRLSPREIDELEVPGHPGERLWRRVPAGTEFWMGSDPDDDDAFDDERPRHRVRIARAFEIAAVPVTGEMFSRFDASESVGKDRADHPAEADWFQASLFCRWLGARLPSEAEWEAACRAGTDTHYWSGDSVEDLARVDWFVKNSGGSRHPVAQKDANGLGLYDVHGNVWEWCQDTSQHSYEGAPDDGSAWEEPGSANRVLRGGSWLVPARYCRSTYRVENRPGYRYDDFGFRPARFIT